MLQRDRNYEEIFRQLQSQQTKGNDFEQQNENFLIQKLDLQTKRKLMRRIVDSFKVLENENVRVQKTKIFSLSVKEKILGRN